MSYGGNNQDYEQEQANDADPAENNSCYRETAATLSST